jgi:hypothetical protein
MPFRRRPLLGAAMVGGGAYMVGRNAARRSQAEASQEARLAELEAQAPPPAPAPAPAPATDLVAQLTQLKALQDAGALSADEFEAAKRTLLANQ